MTHDFQIGRRVCKGRRTRENVFPLGNYKMCSTCLRGGGIEDGREAGQVTTAGTEGRAAGPAARTAAQPWCSARITWELKNTHQCPGLIQDQMSQKGVGESAN